MSAPTTVRSATRRLVGLTALRWLPVGLTTPITVLLAQARGLTLGEIGVLFTVHGVLVVALELPTGGLADVLGRRPVVVAGAVLHIASCLLFATATTFAGFLVGIVALGLGRVLDSGPAEAWYVDTVHRIDPAADVAPGLAKHGAADGGSLAVGAVVGGFLPGAARRRRRAGARAALPRGRRARRGVHRRRRPAAHRGAAAPRGQRRGRARRRCPRGAGDGERSGAAVGHRRADAAGAAADRRRRRRAGRLRAARAGAVRRPRRRAGRRRRGVRHGARRSPSRSRRSGRWPTRRCAGCCAARPGRRARCCSRSAPPRWPWWPGPTCCWSAGAGFALYYLAHGSTWPLLSAVLHTRVDAAHRATAVSAMSLALALGGIVGNLAVPPLAAALGTGAAFLAVAVVVLLGAVACLRLPRATVAPADAEAAPLGVV